MDSQIIPPLPSLSERNWVIAAHLAGLVPLFLVGLLFPLLIYCYKKPTSFYIAQETLCIVHFRLSILIYDLALLLVLFMTFWMILTIPVVIFLWVLLLLVDVICCVRGALAAASGLSFHYPFSLFGRS